MARDNSLQSAILDVLIVGAGPAGLAAGIASAKMGLEYLILEKGKIGDIPNFQLSSAEQKRSTAG